MDIIDNIKFLLYFLIIFCSFAILYFYFYLKQLSEKKVALNCSHKISVAEYEKMKKELTERELKKLKESKEFKNYMINKNLLGGEQNQESEQEESEKDE